MVYKCFQHELSIDIIDFYLNFFTKLNRLFVIFFQFECACINRIKYFYK